MNTAQWPQEIVVRPIEEILVRNTCPRPPLPPPPVDHQQERKPRAQNEQALNCPRCHSTNTKFCYYNNYSLTQPRYFCKTCRRYWTEGGSLRNIPVGGCSRKNKRSPPPPPPPPPPSPSSSSSSSYNTNNSSSSSSSSMIIPPPPKNIKLSNINNDNNNPSKVSVYEGQDLNLSFPNISASSSASSYSSSTITTTSHHTHNFSALELLNGITTSRGSNTSSTATFMPVPSSSSLLPTHDDPNIGYTSFPLLLHRHDFKPNSLNFSLDGIESTGFGSLQETTSGGGDGRILFPFEDLKHGSNSTTTMDQDSNNKEQEQGHSTGYWTSMLGGGSW